ncbi:MAG: RagB/SusD family nutrient uptake outer membrane protein, partial [Bacteroidota bacterium]
GGQNPSDGFLQNQFNRFEISTTNEIVFSIWKRNYHGIGRANFVIEKGADLLGGEEDDRVNELIAEARFLRAYFHFELARFFENIPILDFLPATTEEAIVPQSDPEDIYAFIASDLLNAIDLVPERTGTARVSKWAAQSLLARVYLFKKGVYGGAITTEGTTIDDAFALRQLEDVINNSGHDLLNNYDSIFFSRNEFGVESVLEIAHEPNPIFGDWGPSVFKVEGNLAAQMMGPRVASSDIYYRGWSFGLPSHKLFLALENDPRLSGTILTRQRILAEPGASLIESEGYQLTGYYNFKYTTRIEDRGDGTLELYNSSNQRVIRFSDVLLMAAELSQNADYLNRVRARVGLATIPYSEEALFKERQLEFGGEGIRYFDLMRRGVSVMNQELNISGIIGPNYKDADADYEVSADLSTIRGFLPIPQLEVDLSDGVLIQNNGY